mmetsp:Transcript_29441/g.80517  ORF Transcript_29441/g.80517 Transcript_29441/m.80517 type:complete len:386 (-) Transcript_29441:51-1208(-)
MTLFVGTARLLVFTFLGAATARANVVHAKTGRSPDADGENVVQALVGTTNVRAHWKRMPLMRQDVRRHQGVRPRPGGTSYMVQPVTEHEFGNVLVEDNASAHESVGESTLDMDEDEVPEEKEQLQVRGNGWPTVSWATPGDLTRHRPARNLTSVGGVMASGQEEAKRNSAFRDGFFADSTRFSDKWARFMPSMKLRRRSRVRLTLTLCTLGVAILLLQGGWWEALRPWSTEVKREKGKKLRWPVGTAWATLLCQTVMINPMVEYVVHRQLHAFHVRGHLEHHVKFWVTTFAEANHLAIDDHAVFEAWPYVLALIAYPFGPLRAVCFGLLQYALFHQLCHDAPWLVPGTSEPHMRHHAHADVNYCISLPASLHWPDLIFGGFQDGS